MFDPLWRHCIATSLRNSYPNALRRLSLPLSGGDCRGVLRAEGWVWDAINCVKRTRCSIVTCAVRIFQIIGSRACQTHAHGEEPRAHSKCQDPPLIPLKFPTSSSLTTPVALC